MYIGIDKTAKRCPFREFHNVPEVSQVNLRFESAVYHRIRKIDYFGFQPYRIFTHFHLKFLYGKGVLGKCHVRIHIREGFGEIRVLHDTLFDKEASVDRRTTGIRKCPGHAGIKPHGAGRGSSFYLGDNGNRDFVEEVGDRDISTLQCQIQRR